MNALIEPTECRSAALELISTWAAEEPTGLVSRRQVIDKLLDLRNLLSGPDLVVVDTVLSGVPGITVVESSWWLEQMAFLRETIEASMPSEAS